MLTYVINTSENRTLDSDRLFDLAGYNKIRWLNCPLSDIGQCAQYIYEKQNVLGAEQFRIAVLIDFFGFDRIRVPYGRLGFRPEVGVDISLYMPYIEIFLMDNLITYLENREMRSADFEIYYVQNAKLERYSFLDNAKEQLHQILVGHEVADEQEALLAEPVSDPESDAEEAPHVPEGIDGEGAVAYTSFSLYCTKNVSLTFRLADYPYGAEAMTFDEFFHAFSERVGQKDLMRRHYYVSNYGGGRARAAYDTLTLSLYLIRMYEREEDPVEEGELEVAHIDSELLRDVLETAWSKIDLARTVAKGNQSKYYSLKQNIRIDSEEQQNKEEADANVDALPELSAAEPQKLSPEELYARICHYHCRTPEEVAAENREEFDRIMSEYLERRDETREASVEAELEDAIRSDALVTTNQFPSKEEYLYLVAEKQKDISDRFEVALAAEYIDVEYSEEKKRADKAYDRYCHVKACMHRNIVGDVIFLILTLLAMVVPYGLLQLSDYDVPTASVITLALLTTALFGGIFVLAVILQVITLAVRLNKAKVELRGCFSDCFKKDRLSMSQIRRRYREDLLYIERTRYEIRQLKYLYEANIAKDANVKRHREMLEEVEDRLSSMLNNLDVEPIPDPDETIFGEFDLTKPIRSRENKVYRVFSIETIEKLFQKKGRDEL